MIPLPPPVPAPDSPSPVPAEQHLPRTASPSAVLASSSTEGPAALTTSTMPPSLKAAAAAQAAPWPRVGHRPGRPARPSALLLALRAAAAAAATAAACPPSPPPALLQMDGPPPAAPEEQLPPRQRRAAGLRDVAAGDQPARQPELQLRNDGPTPRQVRLGEQRRLRPWWSPRVSFRPGAPTGRGCTRCCATPRPSRAGTWRSPTSRCSRSPTPRGASSAAGAPGAADPDGLGDARPAGRPGRGPRGTWPSRWRWTSTVRLRLVLAATGPIWR